jgi:hypothetical protein
MSDPVEWMAVALKGSVEGMDGYEALIFGLDTNWHRHARAALDAYLKATGNLEGSVRVVLNRQPQEMPDMSNVQPERQPETPPNTTFPVEPKPAKAAAPDAVEVDDPVDEAKHHKPETIVGRAAQPQVTKSSTFLSKAKPAATHQGKRTSK